MENWDRLWRPIPTSMSGPPLSPSLQSGPTNGTPITITGTNFQVGAQVTIGDLPAGDVVVQDSTTITANTPGLPVGPADVTVTNPDTGTITSAGGFTYALGTGPINYIQRGDAVTTCLRPPFLRRCPTCKLPAT